MRKCLEDIVKEVEKLNTITVCDREFVIIWVGGTGSSST